MRHTNYLRLLLTTLTAAVIIHAGVGQPDGSLAAQIPVPGAFSKLSPPSGALYSSTVPLTWSPSTNAASYEYCIDFIDDNFCNRTWTNVGNNTSVNALVIGYSDFWWQVRARNGNNVTTASEGWWKLRIVSPPADFSKTAPLNSVTNQSISVLLQWTASFGMTRYEYCRDTVINNTCDGAWVSTGLFASVVLNGLVPGSTYEWQVRAVNLNGITAADGGTWWRFSTRALPLGTYFFEDLETSGHFGWGRNGFWGVSTEASHSPTHAWSDSPGFPYDIDSDTWIDSPAIDVSRATNPQLRFLHRHDIAAGDEANVWVSPDDGFTWTHLTTYSGSNLSWHPAVIDLTPYAGVTHLRIEFAVWSNGDLATGDGWYVDDVVVAESGPPGAFSKTSPPSNTTGIASAATLSWGLSGGAVDYEYCIDLTNNNVCDSGWISTGSDTAVNISLNSSTSYYWEVRAVNGAGVRLADAGNWWTFSTAGPPIVISHPQIVTPPVSQLVPWGGTTTLSVGAVGVAPLVYQWYQGTSGDTSAPIAGATAASYTTPALTSPTNVWVRVSNAFGSTGSATATVSLGVAGSGTMRKTDFDGDGKADIAVWRPSTGVWWILRSDGHTTGTQWGALGDVPVAGDYDGDHKTDIAVWRPSTGVWWVIKSSDGLIRGQQWGTDGDIPVAGDYDGDLKTDIAIWRPSTGVWWIIKSSDGLVTSRQWGANGDIPVAGDYDGDGKTDVAVWRASTGTWWVLKSSTSQVMGQQWGAAYAPYNDVPVPGDYDGDHKTDIAVWRASTGEWWVIRSSNGTVLNRQWGQASLGDRPVAGTDDHDGDDKTDFTVWRAPTGVWYGLDSATNYETYWYPQWGSSTDVPVVD